MIVIPMAGLSSRFARAGYDRPKWMLPLAGRPLFDWSLLSFASLFDKEAFLIVFRETGGAEEFLRSRTEALGVRDLRLVPLSEPTRGQAETVHLGLRASEAADSEALTIFNIDTLRPHYRHPAIAEMVGGWLECFKGEGDHWSFVKEDPSRPGEALQVVEKERISENCCTGMYRFASRRLFEEAYALEQLQPSAKELFVAPLYQRLIERGERVAFSMIDPDEIFFSGVPEEYQAALLQEDKIRHSFSLPV